MNQQQPASLALIPGSRLVIASNNAGKIREIGELLAPFRLDVTSAAEFGLPEPEENGATFAENAAIKACATAEATGLASLADDSGLAVAALDGAPGIYSARWGGEQKDFTLAMNRVQQELERLNIPQTHWQAAFICDLCLCLPDGERHHFEGRVEGTLTFPPRGDHGFGYDPIFIPEDETRTFAQMPAPEKQAVSHRARAFAKLVSALG